MGTHLNPPPLKRCICGSWYCGISCRFANTEPAPDYRVSDYANYHIKHDQEQRHIGRPEDDFDAFGQPLKAGT
jgi:hypothetical protein